MSFLLMRIISFSCKHIPVDECSFIFVLRGRGKGIGPVIGSLGLRMFSRGSLRCRSMGVGGMLMLLSLMQGGSMLKLSIKLIL